MTSNFQVLRSFCKTAFLAFGLLLLSQSFANAGGLRIRSYGHSSLLIKGGGKSVLLNPFNAVGCAAGLSEPRVKADVILASSELADEGARIAKGVFLVQPGSYNVRSLKFEGFSVPHDRYGGRRYGSATFWQWNQAGLRIAHLGSGVATLSPEEKILLGRPDVLVIGVGGGSKVFTAKEAAKLVLELKPKHVIPVQFVRGNVPKNCDQSGVEPFLSEMKSYKLKKVGRTFNLRKNISNEIIINLIR